MKQTIEGGENTSRWGTLVGAVGVLLLTAAVYAPAASHGFVNYDDQIVLLNRERVRSLSVENLLAIWTTPHKMDFFPLTETSYAIEYALVGYAPRLYHVTNIVLHLACTGLVLALVRSLGFGALAATVAAAAFGLHPIHVETGAWVADRKDLLACLFSLLSILSFLTHHRRALKKYYAFALIAGLAAILSKPSAVSLGATVFVVQMCVLRAGFRRSIIRSLPLLVAGLALSVMIFWMHQVGGNIRPETYTAPAQSLMLAVYGFAFPLWRFAWPHPLIPVYEHVELTASHWITWAALGTSAVFFGLAWRHRRNIWVLLGLGWYATGIVPVLRFVQVGTMVVADRYMYFPSVGLCVLAGIGAERWWAKPPGRLSPAATRTGLVAGMAVIAIGLTLMTGLQVGIWKNSETLWRYTLKHNPNTAQAHNNLGIYLQSLNRKQEAMDQFLKSVEIRPDYAEANTNLANLLQEQGKIEQAIQHYQIALKSEPDHVFANMNMANVLAQRGQLQEAEKIYRRVLKMEPRLAPANLNLAHTLYQMKRLPEAIEHYEITYEQQPQDFRLCLRIADLYYMTGQAQKAVRVAQGGLAKAEAIRQTKWAAQIRRRISQYKTPGPQPKRR